MITDLHLKGIDLQVYAILYGFTQDGETEFSGSQQYLCDFCGGVSRPTVANALKRLTEAGLIIKQTDPINGVIFNRYKISLDHVKNLYMGEQNSLGGCKNTLQGGCKKILHNKESIDIEDISNNNISSEFEQIWAVYPRKEGKKKAFEAYQRSRKNGVDFETILRGVRNYADKVRRERTEARYIKMGSTYFSGDCWDDIFEPEQTECGTDEPPTWDGGMSKQDRRRAAVAKKN